MHYIRKMHGVHTVNRRQLEEGFIRKLNVKCSQRDNHSCMMLKLIVYMNRIFKKSSIDINENLKVTQTREPTISDDNDNEDDEMLARSMENSDNEALGIIIGEKIWRFIRSRELRYHVADNADLIVTTEPKGNLHLGLSISPIGAVEEGRGKMKNYMPIMAMMMAKMGMVTALFLKGLMLLTGKALIVSKLALILAVIIGLKKLLSKKHVTYEVVAHPHHHEPHHDTYSTGWGRALDGFLDGVAELPAKILDSHEMAYSGQKPENNF
ncbi:uncharacterized protein LOC129613069 [Condylostylus longicornis]|uniref:uncharacterized protein LOC129613069 n=1 Tax=Condylostylus longicornis TaxID=2530218 RepID=UPI00244DD4EC|nr:uncharacterized protein LOC129613069 [Condylostylus longicornis]